MTVLVTTENLKNRQTLFTKIDFWTTKVCPKLKNFLNFWSKKQGPLKEEYPYVEDILHSFFRVYLHNVGNGGFCAGAAPTFALAGV